MNPPIEIGGFDDEALLQLAADEGEKLGGIDRAAGEVRRGDQRIGPA
jgi:hypothetical protein